MLVIQIAFGVFGGLLLFWYFYKRSLRLEGERNAAKAKLAEDAATVKQYGEDLELFRGVVFSNYLKVYEDRLLTLEDDKTITFQDAGLIELKIFYEHCSELMDKIKKEEQEAIAQRNCDQNLSASLNVALNEFISHSTNVLHTYALKRFEEKVLEIANKNYRGDGAVSSGSAL